LIFERKAFMQIFDHGMWRKAKLEAAFDGIKPIRKSVEFWLKASVNLNCIHLSLCIASNNLKLLRERGKGDRQDVSFEDAFPFDALPEGIHSILKCITP